jgi:hypothetical protein
MEKTLNTEIKTNNVTQKTLEEFLTGLSKVCKSCTGDGEETCSFSYCPFGEEDAVDIIKKLAKSIFHFHEMTQEQKDLFHYCYDLDTEQIDTFEQIFTKYDIIIYSVSLQRDYTNSFLIIETNCEFPYSREDELYHDLKRYAADFLDATVMRITDGFVIIDSTGNRLMLFYL